MKNALTKNLYITKLHLITTPGFPDGGPAIDQLCPGINIIYGPNASGKSTFARAAQALFWPHAAKKQLPRTQIKGEWVVNEQAWNVDYKNGKARYYYNNSPVQLENIPPLEQRNRYLLTLNDLLSDLNTPLAEAIIRESTGGFDILRAFDTLGSRPEKPRKGEKTNDVQHALQKVNQTALEQQNLLPHQKTLVELRHSLNESKCADYLYRQVSLALEYRSHKHIADELLANLQEIPSIVQQVQGDEPERLQDLFDVRATLSHDLSIVNQQAIRAKQQLDAFAPLITNDSNESALHATRAYIESWRTTESQFHQLQVDLHAARQIVSKEKDRLIDITFIRPTDTEGGEIELPPTDELIEILRKVEHAKHEKTAAKELTKLLRSWLNTSSLNHDQQRQLDNGIRLLQQWLSISDSIVQINHRAYLIRIRLLIIAISAILALGAVPIMLRMPIVGVALLMLSAALVVGAYWSSKLLAQYAHRHSASENLKAEYQRLALPQPDHWTAQSVKTSLEHLLHEKQITLWNDHLQQAIDASEPNIESSKADSPLAAPLHLFAEKYGLNLNTDNANIVLYINRLNQLFEAEARAAQLDSKQRIVLNKSDELAHKIATIFQQYHIPAPLDSVQASAQLYELEQRLNKAKQAEQHYQSTLDKQAIVQAQFDANQNAIDRILERLELHENELDKLQSLVQLKQSYTEYHKKYLTEQQLCDNVYHRLINEIERYSGCVIYDDSSPRLEDFLNLPVNELEDMAEKFGMMRDEKDAILNRIARLETELNQAMQSDILENARASYDRACDILELEREEFMTSSIRRALTQFVIEQTQQTEMPQVFHHARHLFERITNGRYQLSVGDYQSPGFRAWDSHLNEVRTLDELSKGTRLQLLVAVRLAFVELHENSVQLPLIFDETLANSDDERAATIIQTLINIAANGRQIFYLTAQHDEVSKWQDALISASKQPVNHRVVELSLTTPAGEGRRHQQLESISK